MTQKSNLLSDKKLEQIAAGKMWDFHGGVHPEQNKLQSNQSPITDAGIPEELIIAVEQKGHIPQLLVAVGDTVLKGQPLTKVYGALVVQHASSSGVVKAIEPRTDCHPSGLPVLSIVIETDGLDRPFPSQGFSDYRQEMPATLIEATQQAGIVGLGGAGFATHLKLAHSENRLLIINAIECEPYITADDRLIQEHADEIIEGINILQHILQPKLTIFAVEDNKPEAIEAFTKSLQSIPGAADNILLRVIPTRYPSGSAKQLIEVLTGEQTPINKHSSELGISMFNVGTAFAVKEAIINGKPLVSRIVTITGDAFARKGNASVRIGTPIQHLLDTYWLNALHHQQLIIGGPMMGFTVSDPSMPVSKTCNCILAPTEKELPQPEPEMNCIRCSECAEACPVELLPQQLLWYSQSEDHKKLEEYDLSACIECGACAFVCPSHIPLVEYYRVSKSQIKAAKFEAEKAAIARKRHEDRERRLETEKQQRQLKHKLAAEKRKEQMQDKNGGEDLVAAALARAKAKKQANSEAPAEAGNKPTAANSQVAAAIARAKAKKQAADSGTQSENNVDADPKKATVAAAIARAKAKKQAAAEAKAQSDSSENNIETDPKKAAVAAAIARAKAKKQAAAEAKAQSDSSENNIETDPKKAAVAAAIARAKAKKKAAAEAKDQPTTSDASEDNVEAEVDPKKAAIAAAVARAKAKKQAAVEAKDQPTTSDASEDNVETEVDPKKAAIAAAVARAKAKKKQPQKLKISLQHQTLQKITLKLKLILKKRQSLQLLLALKRRKKQPQKLKISLQHQILQKVMLKLKLILKKQPSLQPLLALKRRNKQLQKLKSKLQDQIQQTMT
ncbi:electron transport complex subunit RsxC [Psychromonas sp. KJ10-2]|uniref:electron transport complex subunit RsxC n=1 Tax=Psychromonas sp. KJ10-2 TaxID=3391822 RepID=UPI0039B43B89